MENFLPVNYSVPTKSGSYMKLADGTNRIRILGSAIVGWVGWKTSSDGARKPVRRRIGETISMNEIDDEDRVKHFWAFPVWNYQDEQVQILEVTQKGIQKAITALINDKDWGNPKEYDLVITRTGQKLETEYQVQPKPSKKLDEAIVEIYKNTPINLEALYENGDPFKETEVKVEDMPDFDQ